MPFIIRFFTIIIIQTGILSFLRLISILCHGDHSFFRPTFIYQIFSDNPMASDSFISWAIPAITISFALSALPQTRSSGPNFGHFRALYMACLLLVASFLFSLAIVEFIFQQGLSIHGLLIIAFASPLFVHSYFTYNLNFDVFPRRFLLSSYSIAIPLCILTIPVVNNSNMSIGNYGHFVLNSLFAYVFGQSLEYFIFPNEYYSFFVLLVFLTPGIAYLFLLSKNFQGCRIKNELIDFLFSTLFLFYGLQLLGVYAGWYCACRNEFFEIPLIASDLIRLVAGISIIFSVGQIYRRFYL